MIREAEQPQARCKTCHGPLPCTPLHFLDNTGTLEERWERAHPFQPCLLHGMYYGVCPDDHEGVRLVARLDTQASRETP